MPVRLTLAGIPTVGSYEGGVSYERGILAGDRVYACAFDARSVGSVRFTCRVCESVRECASECVSGWEARPSPVVCE